MAGRGEADDADFSGRKFNFPAVLSCASVVVVVALPLSLPLFLSLSRSLNELSEYLHKIKCCPTSWPAREGREGERAGREEEREGREGERGGRGRGRGAGEAAQLTWQTCLKVAARLSRRSGTEKGRKRREGQERERRQRKAAQAEREASCRGAGGHCMRPHTKEMEKKQRTTKHKYETRSRSSTRRR